MRKRSILSMAAAGLLFTGCLDLDVTNPNRPDLERAAQDPAALQTLVGGNFTQLFWPSVQNGYPNLGMAAMADALTSGFLDFGIHDVSVLPRVAWDNDPTYRRSGLAEVRWSRSYEILSNVNSVITQFDDGFTTQDPTTGADNTAQMEAFARLMQGLATGYLAMHFDQAVIFDEHTDIENMDPTDYRPYTEVLNAALRQLDAAIAVAQANTFRIPGDITWVNGVPITDQDLIRLANSYAARFIAYTPRTPAERQQADWNEVLRRVDAGIITDFAPHGVQDILDSEYRYRIGRNRAGTPGDFMRVNNRLVGPADISGNFQAWMATPVQDREPFTITTPDRRIQGADDPNDNPDGAYFGFDESTIFSASRGLYMRSYYHYHRWSTGDQYFSGPQPTMIVKEMDLLKAEGLIRLGRAEEAVPIINEARVEIGQLPPVTVAGPPDDDRCVPRRDNGDCGSLWDALRYEKFVENVGVEGGIMYYDARGFGYLPEGTHLHFPVPGRELETLGLGPPFYTFGGPGEDAAPAPTHEVCPVALPRCT